MKCADCGADVVREAIYCHKCGARIDLQAPQTDLPDRALPDAASEELSGEQFSDQAAREAALSPAERLKRAVAAKRDQEDDPEKELWEGRYSTKAMLPAWVASGAVSLLMLVLAIWQIRSATWWGLMLLAIVLLWLYQLLVVTYRRMNARYLLTTQRFVHQTGILRRVTDRIEVIDMDDITFEQSLLERLVGVGTIRITSSDVTHPNLTLRGIEQVGQVSRLIDQTRRNERVRRGLHIEAV